MRALVTFSVYLVYAITVAIGLAAIRRRSKAGITQVSPRWWVAAAAGIGLGMLAMAEPLRGMFQDFLDAYYAGGLSVLAGATSADQLYSRGVNGFVNVPIAGVVFVPLALLPGEFAALVYLGLGVVATVAAWRLLVRLAELDAQGAALLGLCVCTNGPLMNSLKEGNTSHFALWAIAAAMLYVRDGKDARAGALLAAISVFKLPLLLFFVWGALRGRWRLVFTGGAVLAAVAGSSVLGFGWDVHSAWYHQFVASAGGQLVAAFNNQSFPALFVRFARPAGTLCSWDPIVLDRTSQVLSSVVRVILLAGAVLAARWQGLKTVTARISTTDETETEMVMVALLTCLLSPLSWSHYYCWALLGIALLLRRGWRHDSRGVRATSLLATVLVSLPVAWPWCSPTGPLSLPYVLFSSHYVIGATLLLGLLAWHRAVGTLRPVVATHTAPAERDNSVGS